MLHGQYLHIECIFVARQQQKRRFLVGRVGQLTEYFPKVFTTTSTWLLRTVVSLLCCHVEWWMAVLCLTYLTYISLLTWSLSLSPIHLSISLLTSSCIYICLYLSIHHLFMSSNLIVQVLQSTVVSPPKSSSCSILWRGQNGRRYESSLSTTLKSFWTVSWPESVNHDSVSSYGTILKAAFDAHASAVWTQPAVSAV